MEEPVEDQLNSMTEAGSEQTWLQSGCVVTPVPSELKVIKAASPGQFSGRVHRPTGQTSPEVKSSSLLSSSSSSPQETSIIEMTKIGKYLSSLVVILFIAVE